MVNPGGPSKGCLTCIRRKIRCDRQRPTCGQCQKSARSCEGYRSQADLVFRDQTHIVHAKVARDRESRPEQPNVAASDAAGTWVASYFHSGPVLLRSPKLNAEQSLIQFFTNNFVCSGIHRGTNLFWVPNNFDDLLKNDAARCSVRSVGAMALARLRRSTHYYREAQNAYGVALLSLAGSWRSGIGTDPNAAMIATLFLGFFEILASDLSTSRQSWMTHIRGLGSIMKQRGGQAPNPSFGAQMLLQSRSQVILNALQTKTQVPAQFQTLSKSMHPSMPPHVVPVDTADMLLIRLATLQAQYCTSRPANALIADLLALDTDIDHWIQSVPSSWSFTSRLSGYPSEFEWERHSDAYPTPAIAHVSNKMRAARIVVYDLIQEANSLWSLSDDDPPNAVIGEGVLGDSAETLQQLVTRICATIPIYYRPSYVTNASSGSQSPPQLGTTYWIFWPLEVVGSMGTASQELTEWVKQCFERIYDTTGILKAQAAAQRIAAASRPTTVA